MVGGGETGRRYIWWPRSATLPRAYLLSPTEGMASAQLVSPPSNFFANRRYPANGGRAATSPCPPPPHLWQYVHSKMPYLHGLYIYAAPGREPMKSFILKTVRSARGPRGGGGHPSTAHQAPPLLVQLAILPFWRDSSAVLRSRRFPRQPQHYTTLWPRDGCE